MSRFERKRSVHVNRIHSAMILSASPCGGSSFRRGYGWFFEMIGPWIQNRLLLPAYALRVTSW